MVSIVKKPGLQYQLGGTFLGFIVGVVFGLAAALAVAVYVTKVPIPFVTKIQSRSANQDAAEAIKNKDWDPNAPLYGKTPIKPAPSASATAGGTVAPMFGASAPITPKADARPAVSADPLGDLARARSSVSTAEPFVYFVQIGAFKTAEDAETQRAKVSLSGIDARVSEREQSGRTVFRVRAGPFDRKDDADKTKEKLDGAGFETAIVRVQR
ncbi:MAG TPA: SPOR domain-containing protein [Burkholderiaceae bacterium]|mgnify:FL=1|nr:SPOR domain-containing protein [Burkholderiaceae bacterium]